MNSRHLVLRVFIGERRSFQWKCSCVVKRCCCRCRYFRFVASRSSFVIVLLYIQRKMCVFLCMCSPYDCEWITQNCMYTETERVSVWKILWKVFACVIRRMFQVNKAEAEISRLSHALFVVFIPLDEFHLCVCSILKYGGDDDFYRKITNKLRQQNHRITHIGKWQNSDMKIAASKMNDGPNHWTNWKLWCNHIAKRSWLERKKK